MLYCHDNVTVLTNMLKVYYILKHIITFAYCIFKGDKYIFTALHFILSQKIKSTCNIYLSKGDVLFVVLLQALMNQLVNAAMEMYNKGVFHRDLKLENTLVEIGPKGPRLRIIDFGCGSYELKKIFHYFQGIT